MFVLRLSKEELNYVFKTIQNDLIQHEYAHKKPMIPKHEIDLYHRLNKLKQRGKNEKSDNTKCDNS